MTNQILWEERNLIEPPMNCEIKEEQETSDITKSTKTSLMPSDWRSIIDPKLRKKFWAQARAKAYCEANKGEKKAYGKAYYEANKDKFKAYYEANKNEMKSRSKAYAKAYAKANRDKINANRRSRVKTDIQYKLSNALRTRLCHALQGNYKSGSAVRDLGCSIPELQTYLESKFLPGMTWDNHGTHGWHIDHIKPISSFNLSDRNQLLEACHYTNLQPLWAKENMSKGNKI